MEARELRIGNWVWWERDGGYIRITEIDGKDRTNISPIPLTPEILEKAGFVKVVDDIIPCWRLETNDGNSIEWHEDNSVLIGRECSGAYNMPEVKYLHHLMNLYHSLTGQELTISNL